MREEATHSARSSIRASASVFFRAVPSGVAALRERIERLADEPRPPGSFPYGSPDLRYLRAGRYRVFYKVDEDST